MNFKSKNLILLSLFLIIGLLLSFSKTTKQNENISEQQAIVLAEKYIQENGYSNAKPNNSNLNFELFEDKKDTYEILKRRYNTLQAKAFCVSNSDGNWVIGFLSTTVNLKNLNKEKRNSDLSGRAIKVSSNGNLVEIAHKDPRFSFFKKL